MNLYDTNTDTDTEEIGDDPGTPKQQPLPDEHRKKLDSVVTRMIQNKEPEDHIKAVVDDFKNKYQSVAPTPMPDEHTEKFNKTVTKAKDFLSLNPSGVPTGWENEIPNNNAEPIITGQTQKKKLVDHPDFVKALDKVNGDKWESTVKSNVPDLSSIPMMPSGVGDFMKAVMPVPARKPDQIKQERDIELQKAAADPKYARTLLSKVVNNLDNDNLANKIQANGYASDLSNNPMAKGREATINYNVDKIKSGDYGYNLETGQLERNIKNPFDALVNGIDQHSKLMDLASFISGNSDKAVADKLDEGLHEYDPFEAHNKTKGKLNSVAEMLGGLVSPTMKTEGPGAIAGGLMATGEALAPEIALPIAGAFAAIGTASGAQDFHDIAYASTFKDVYSQSRLQGKSQQEAIAEAKKQGSFSGDMAFAQILLMGQMGSKVKETKTPIPERSAFRNLVEIGKHALPQTAIQGSIAGASKGLENLYQGRPISEGTADAALSMGLFAGVATALGTHQSIKNRDKLVDAYARFPDKAIDQSISASVHADAMSETQAHDLKTEVNTYKQRGEFVKSDDEEITPDKKTAEFSKDPRTPTTDDLVAKLPDVQKEMYKQDPDGFLKFIADQVHSGNREEVESGEGMTKQLVETAIEKYPEAPKAAEPEVINPEPTPEVDNSKIESDKQAEIDAAHKPDVKLDLIKPDDLVNSESPIKNKNIHNGLKDRYKELKKIVDCVWP